MQGPDPGHSAHQLHDPALLPLLSAGPRHLSRVRALLVHMANTGIGIQGYWPFSSGINKMLSLLVFTLDILNKKTPIEHGG